MCEWVNIWISGCIVLIVTIYILVVLGFQWFGSDTDSDLDIDTDSDSDSDTDTGDTDIE